ncbi:hypothetical protein ACOMHN_057105 [Nucella lapillus]
MQTWRGGDSEGSVLTPVFISVCDSGGDSEGSVLTPVFISVCDSGGDSEGSVLTPVFISVCDSGGDSEGSVLTPVFISVCDSGGDSEGSVLTPVFISVCDSGGDSEGSVLTPVFISVCDSGGDSEGSVLTPVFISVCDSGGDSEGRPSPGDPRTPRPAAWKGMGPASRPCRTTTRHHHHPLHHTATTTTSNHHHPLHPTTANTIITTTRLFSHHPHPAPPGTRNLPLLLLMVVVAVAILAGESGQRRPVPDRPVLRAVQLGQRRSATLRLRRGEAPPMGGPGGLIGGVGEGEEGVGLKRESMCVALRTYWSCIQGTKNSSSGCQGNIRFYSIRNGVKKQMQHYNCSVQGPTVDPSARGQGSPPPRQVPPQCRYLGGQGLGHCGLFGDPHLRTFGQEFQTCRVKGAWPLVNNQHLTVQVTNLPVLGAAGDATATSKLTVIVKSRPECGWEHYHTYQAQTDELPGSFEDGHTHYGHYNSVRLVEVEPNKHVEIVLEHIATKLIVRQIGRYFTFAIHMPQDLVHEGRDSPEPELCSKGCPSSELIDYKRYLAHKKERVVRLHGSEVLLSRQDAEDTCRSAGLVDFYFDSCVFDMLATGDSNFTVAALSALQDVVRLDPSMAHVANRTSLQVYDDLFGAATSSSCSYLWCCVSCVLSLLWTLCLTGGLPVR